MVLILTYILHHTYDRLTNSALLKKMLPERLLFDSFEAHTRELTQCFKFDQLNSPADSKQQVNSLVSRITYNATVFLNVSLVLFAAITEAASYLLVFLVFSPVRIQRKKSRLL